jgi:hypothetical protein
MNWPSSAVLVLSMYFYPSICTAQAVFYGETPALSKGNDVLFVQTHKCVFYPEEQNPLTAEGAQCIPRTYLGPGNKNINDVAAAMRMDSTPVYTQTATDAGLQLRDRRINALEKKLNDLASSLPDMLGRSVDASVKANLIDILKTLMSADEEFRKAIIDTIRQK